MWKKLIFRKKQKLKSPYRGISSYFQYNHVKKVDFWCEKSRKWMYLDVKKVGIIVPQTAKWCEKSWLFAKITVLKSCEGKNPITLKVIMWKKLLFGCEKSRNYMFQMWKKLIFRRNNSPIVHIEVLAVIFHVIMCKKLLLDVKKVGIIQFDV